MPYELTLSHATTRLRSNLRSAGSMSSGVAHSTFTGDGLRCQFSRVRGWQRRPSPISFEACHAEAIQPGESYAGARPPAALSERMQQGADVQGDSRLRRDDLRLLEVAPRPRSEAEASKSRQWPSRRRFNFKAIIHARWPVESRRNHLCVKGGAFYGPFCQQIGYHNRPEETSGGGHHGQA